MSRQTDIQNLIRTYNRRLQKLKEQEALKGLNTPPETLNEIEDIEAKLDKLQAALQQEPESTTLPEGMADDELEQELARMAAKEQPQSSSTQIGGFNISGISGSTINIDGNIEANVQAGGDIVAGDKITHETPADPNSPQAQLEAALAQWRTELAAIIAKLDDEDDKAYAEKTAAKVVDEAQKGEVADPGKIEGFLKRLGNMAPDIVEVTAKTLQNPFAGVGLVLEKINDRIKLEREE